MGIKNFLINSLIKSAGAGDYHFFVSNLKNTRKIQEQILINQIDKNKKTLFGRKNNFSKIKNTDTFRQSIPVRGYEEYLRYIKKIRYKCSKILTAEDVLLFEPTSGSTSGAKLIPYTASLKMEFHRAVNIWLYDLYNSIPGLLKGKSYWSVSPLTDTKKKGTIPVGFEDDTEYLGGMGKIISMVFPVPAVVKNLHSIKNFRYTTALFLLKARDLALISVWNPTFLILILETIRENLPGIIKDLYDGTLTFPEAGDSQAPLTPFLIPNKRRAGEIEAVCSRTDKINFEQIWKSLKLISCWSDGESRVYAGQIKKEFSNTVIQGKGLIATEGISTIPFIRAAGGALPAYTSHFLEFINNRDCYLIDELIEGEEYTVVMTTGGGFYRYNTHDSVIVTGKYNGLPLLKFTGRQSVCDHYGEKLNETHVNTIIRRVLKRNGLNPQFVIFAVERGCKNGCYTLFLEDTSNNTLLLKAAEEIDTELKENFHYEYARKIGQLLPVRCFRITAEGMKIYISRLVKTGIRQGDIKAALLDRRSGWSSYFKGYFITPGGHIIKNRIKPYSFSMG